jgi:hypothetical protein
MSIPRSLVEAVREHRVVPFVGAGVSVGVKRDLFPAWTRLLENIAHYMKEEGIDAKEVARVNGLVMAGELVLAAETALRALGPYVFHRFLRENYRRQRPPDANLDVVRALWALQPPLVITTNYDSALRWGGPAEVQMVANDQHEELVLLAEATSDWPWIWHLHGTIERMATVILAGRDYKRLYEKDERNRVANYERALFELQKTLASRSLLYVGFGLTDPYVLEQIAHVLELTRGSLAPSYALMKQGQGNRGDLWENYNVRLIEYAEHDMLAGLLNDIAGQAFGAPVASPAPVPAASPATERAGVLEVGSAAERAGVLEVRSAGGPAAGREAGSEAVPRSMDGDSPVPGGRDDDSPIRRAPPAARPAAPPPQPLEIEAVTRRSLDGKRPASGQPDSPPEPDPGPPPTAKPGAGNDLLPMGTSMGGGSKPKANQQKSPAAQPLPASAPVVAQKPIIERSHLVAELGRELLRGCRLLLLAPQGGGARRLTGQIAAAHFGTSVTWLEPPKVPDCTEAQYCGFLAHDDTVDDFFALMRWLEAQAAGGEHLVVLRHDGGPLHHLARLGELLRTLTDGSTRRGGRIRVLVAGEAALAQLRHQALETSLFSDAPVRHVPPFTVGEVAQVLDRAGLGGARWGRDVWQATGGLPALVVEAIAGKEALDAASVTARLARSTAVRGRLIRRLLDDDREQMPAERHARTVLRAMLEAGPGATLVRELRAIEDELGYAETRLFYDGLVIADAQGRTVFRCEAVRRAAAELLAADASAP